MTMMMDNDEKNSARERVQHLLNKNVELENKRRKAAQARIPSDPNTWQNMRENYEAIVLEDHAFSEQHDVEYALWQLHYRRIEELRALFNAALASAGSQNGKGPVRPGPDRLTKIRSQFKTFLSEASGFYHDLMLKIRAKYGLPLGYFSDDPGNQISIAKDGNKFSEVKKGLISCHRCLIYLGDLARYKSLYGEGDPKARDFAAASSYYMQASSIWPSSGNPHHQLAILAGYSNDELLTIYRYFRSLAVENPFITARDNLIIAFEKNRQNYTQILGDAKTATMKTSPRVHGKGRGKGETRSSFKDNKIEANTVKDKASNNFDLFKAFVTRFVRLNGILFTRTSLETFAEVFSLVKSDLLELLSSGPREEANFGSSATECKLTIVRMIAILIFTVHNVNRESENQSYADILQRSVLHQNAFTATFEFMGCVLERCNQLSDPSSSYLLPGIMVFVEWLACFQDVAIGSEVEEKQVNARSFWKKCISFLNKLLSSGYVLVDNDEDETCFTSMGKYDESETANRLALPEDFELRGFLPLLPAQLILDFSRKHSFGCDGGSKERMARVQRIIAAGKALANIVRNGQESVYFDTKEKKFVFGVEPQDDDYLPEPSLSVCSVDIPVGYQMASKTQIDVGAEGEDEDEDEVIVFKPPATEKHVNDLASTLTTTGGPSPVVGFDDVDSRNEIRSSIANDSFLLQCPSSVSLTLSDTVGIPSPVVGFDDIDSRNENRSSIANDSFLLQGPSNASLRLSDTVGNGIPWYPQSVQPNISNPVELGPILNSLAHLNFVENGPQLRSELHEKFGVTQSTSFSIPYPQFVSSQNHSIQTPQATMLSKFDSVMTSKASVDELSVKPSTLVPPSQKKNPVSRPVRHFGPPPGFSSFPSKPAEEPLNSTALKNENRPIATMDDYRWLDGYQLASANDSVGFSSSINHEDPTAFPSVSKSNDQMKITNFPFPGKQVSNMQVQSEKLKGWHEPFGGHMKQYVDHHTKFQNGNQQPTVSPQQYQGQSIWEGRFFV